MDRDQIAKVIYGAWSEGKIVKAWNNLPDCRKHQWIRAADAVLAMLPPLLRSGPQGGPGKREMRR